jgi:hypothetical protein
MKRTRTWADTGIIDGLHFLFGYVFTELRYITIQHMLDVYMPNAMTCFFFERCRQVVQVLVMMMFR